MRLEDHRVLTISPGPFRRRKVPRTPVAIAGRHGLVPKQTIARVCAPLVRCSPRGVSSLTTGMGSATYAVGEPGGEQFVIKFDVFGNHHLEHEALLCTLLRGAYESLPVPRMYHLDLSASTAPYAYLIEESMPGEPLWSSLGTSSVAQSAHAFRQIGAALNRIHALTPSPTGYGRLDEEWYLRQAPEQWASWPFRGEYPRCVQYVLRFVRSHLEFLRSVDLLTDSESAEAWDVLTSFDYSPFQSAHIHGDPNPKNFLFADGVLTGVIDCNTRLAPIEEDLAYLEIYVRELPAVFDNLDATVMRDAFLSGYGEHPCRPFGTSQSRVFCLLCGLRVLVRRVQTEDGRRAQRVLRFIRELLNDPC